MSDLLKLFTESYSSDKFIRRKFSSINRGKNYGDDGITRGIEEVQCG